MALRHCAVLALSAFSIATSSLAQPAASSPPPSPVVGVLDNPCGAVEPIPADVIAFAAATARAKAEHRPAPVPPAEGLKRYNEWQQRQLLTDFGGLCRYRAANATLTRAGDHRVVFFGDSITELWGVSGADLFKDDVLNRGISGQTTMQMLDRYREDVIALHPKVVHIIAGTNDIAGNTGPTTLAWVEQNIETMVEMAQAHHIRVVLGAIPPAARFGWRPQLTPAATIVAYDHWLADYARRNNLEFVDYHAALDDGNGAIRAGLSEDGVHPTPAGYALMRPLAVKAIAKALAKPAP